MERACCFQRFLPSKNLAGVPPLCGPTRRKTARKKESGRSGQDDNFKMFAALKRKMFVIG